MTLPAHLPDRLTITLWDFSWYVRTGPGEPFEDLDAAFAQAVERGYNTVRICAMPFLLAQLDVLDGAPERARERLDALLAQDPHHVDALELAGSLPAVLEETR